MNLLHELWTNLLHELWTNLLHEPARRKGIYGRDHRLTMQTFSCRAMTPECHHQPLHKLDKTLHHSSDRGLILNGWYLAGSGIAWPPCTLPPICHEEGLTVSHCRRYIIAPSPNAHEHRLHLLQSEHSLLFQNWVHKMLGWSYALCQGVGFQSCALYSQEQIL